MLIFFILSSILLHIRIKFCIDFLCIICSLQLKSWKKIRIRIRSVFEFLYLLFENIYDKFEVYFLWIFTRSMLNTRLWIYIVNYISYLSIIEEKWLKIWHSNKHPNPSLPMDTTLCIHYHDWVGAMLPKLMPFEYIYSTHQRIE